MLVLQGTLASMIVSYSVWDGARPQRTIIADLSWLTQERSYGKIQLQRVRASASSAVASKVA